MIAACLESSWAHRAAAVGARNQSGCVKDACVCVPEMGGSPTERASGIQCLRILVPKKSIEDAVCRASMVALFSCSGARCMQQFAGTRLGSRDSKSGGTASFAGSIPVQSKTWLQAQHDRHKHIASGAAFHASRFRAHQTTHAQNSFYKA